MAFPVRVGVSTAHTASNGNLILSYPEDSAPGSLIVISCSFGRQSSSAADFSIDGPTWIVAQDNNMGSGLRDKVLWGIRGSESSVTITPSPNNNTNAVRATAVAYAGQTVSRSDPVGASSTFGSVSNGTAVAPSVTTAIHGSEVLYLACFWGSGSTALTVSWSSGVEIIDESAMSASNNFRVAQAVAFERFGNSAATGNETATASRTVAARRNTAIVIQPAVASGRAHSQAVWRSACF